MIKKKFTRLLLTLGLLIPMAVIKPVSAQSGSDTLAPQVTTLRDRISGIEERIMTAEGDLSKLTKIKLSGYIQAQYFHYEQSSNYPYDNFMIRRARVKITYEPTTGVAFGLEPDFQPGNFSIKNAYVQLNEPWLKTFSLWAGKFDRPDYEVEYSSSNLECLERSKVITTLYPDEKAIGFKLEVTPPKTNLKVQLALVNGNEGYTYTDATGATINAAQNNVDFDGFKDLMARATYAFKLGRIGGLTIGAHEYYGHVKANSHDLLNSDYTYNKSESNVGNSIKRTWTGVEAQLYLDVLGGLALKGEYIFGINGTPGYYGSSSVVSPVTISMRNDTLIQTLTTTTTSTLRPAIERKFMGYYVYLIKNIGKRNQFSVRYDYYDPNTKIKTDSIGYSHYSVTSSKTADKFTYTTGTNVVGTNNQTITKVSNSLTSMNSLSDIAFGTWTFAWTYYFSDNIKIQLAYSIPVNEKVPAAKYDKTSGKETSGVVTNYTVNNVSGSYDYSKLIKQNFLTLRIQAKF